jgi:hypothetical protein
MRAKGDLPEVEPSSGSLSRRRFVGLALGVAAQLLAACGRLSAPATTPTPGVAAAPPATASPEPATHTPSPAAPAAPTLLSSATAPATAIAAPVGASPTPLPATYTPVPATPTLPPQASATPLALPGRATLMAHWPAVDRSRVVAIYHSGAWAGDTPDPATVLQMLDAGVSTLAGIPDVAAVWRILFDPGDRVLVKVNCIAYGGPTQPAVAYAVAQRVQQAGVPGENILIFDRTDGELAAAGYTLNERAPGVRCHGSRGAGTRIALSQAKVRLYRELDDCDALINIPTPKQHGTAGISVSLKNHYGSVDEPGRLHGSRCDPAIAELNAQPAIRDKTRLIVGAALAVSADDWDHPVRENALLLSFDPVALDTVARDILVRRRQELGLSSTFLIEGAPQLATAQALQLGTAEPGRIDLREVRLG